MSRIRASFFPAKWSSVLLSVSGLFPCAGIQAGEPIQQAVAALVESAVSGSGITEAEQKASQAVIQLGTDAFPEVIKLLKHGNPEVIALASYTLSDFPAPVDPVYLPALMDAQRPLGAEGWLPPVIAKTGTPDGYDFLLGLFLAEPRFQTQLGWALQLSGRHLLPHLLSTYRTSAPDESQLSGFCELMKEMDGKDSQEFLVPLLELAADATKPETIRAAALTTAGQIKSAEEQADAFRKINATDLPLLQTARQKVLFSFNGRETLDDIISHLKGSPPHPDSYLERLSELKQAGLEAGPFVLPFLTSKEVETACGAMRAVGAIGYQSAVPVLINLLAEETDWRIVITAAASLAALQAKDATPALSTVAVNHWYPLVRETALKAIRVIESGPSVAEADSMDLSNMRHFSQEHFRDEEQIEAFMAKHRSNAVEEQWITKKASDFRRRIPEGEVNYDLEGFATGGGLLLGWDRGEFGGALEFFPAKGGRELVVRDPVKRLHTAQEGFVAICGMAHMGTNDGNVHKILRDGSVWKSTLWRALPGAPFDSLKMKDGRLLIVCGEGALFLHPDGKMEWLEP